MSNSPFLIKALDSNGDMLGDAPIRNVRYVNNTEVLDGVGSCNFGVIASDPMSAVIVDAYSFEITDEQDGLIGEFIKRDYQTSDDDGLGVIDVRCWSLMRELQYAIIGFQREFAGVQVGTIVNTLVTSVSGWSTSAEAGIGLAEVVYQGQTIFDGVQELAQRWGRHFRLTSNVRELEFRQLGSTTTDVRLMRLPGQDDYFAGNTDEIAIIKSLSYSEDWDGIYNEIIGLASGHGSAQITLEGATGGAYTVQQVTATGKDYYVIRDSTSVTNYGKRQLTLVVDGIRPINNTTASKQDSKNELLIASETFLTRHKDPYIELGNVTVYGLTTDIAVGDKIPVFYRALDTDGTNTYININDDYWIQEITYRRQATGQRSTVLELTNIDRKPENDIEIIKGTVKRINSQRLLIAPTAVTFKDSDVDTVQAFVGIAGKNAEFTIPLDDDTLTDVEQVIIEFETRPLYSFISPPSQIGQSTPFDITVSSVDTTVTNPHTHTVTTASGNFVSQSWGVVENDQYPRDIECFFIHSGGTENITNNVNVDYISGGNGKWNPNPNNNSVKVKMDITDMVKGVAADIYEDFVIRFTCDPTSSAQDVTFAGNVTNTSTVASQGIIRFAYIVRASTMAKYKD